MDPPSIGEAVVRVDGLSKSYGRVRALDDVAFYVCTGEILGLIGPNGAGKTTLFECVAGLEAADQGRVFFGSVPVGGQRRSTKLFYVPDGIAPWGDQPVSWVLDYSIGFFAGRREIYQQVIADLALEPLMRVPIRSLSKGQRKRTLLALGLLAPQPIIDPLDPSDLSRPGHALEQAGRVAEDAAGRSGITNRVQWQHRRRNAPVGLEHACGFHEVPVPSG